ncbi:uncharacterized protein ACJ7VT_006924 isoform 1-T2 [Polymixia lowei]
MDRVAISRRNHNINKGNKENAEPTCRSKSSLKRNVSKTVASSVVPLHLKSNEKEETLTKNGVQTGKPKQEKIKLTSREPVKKIVQKDGKVNAISDAKKRQTLSRAFLTEQAVKHRKLVTEAAKPPAAKPPAAMPPTKSAPGMYKGKVVQSKIGSIWKPSAAMGGTDQKPTAKPLAPKVEGRKVGDLTKQRSKSVVDMSGCRVQRPQPARSKSVSDGPLPVSKQPVNSRPVTGFRSAVASARTIHTTLAGPSSSRTTVMPKGKVTQSNKPRVPVTDKVNKPPVSSNVSQYRVLMGTAEERRAKLAEWLASKGKTLKRPAMATAAPPKTKVAIKPEIQIKSHIEPEPCLHGHGPGTAAAQPKDSQRPEKPAHNSTPQIKNTTLDLLENSDMDLPVDPEARMSDVVVNLCDALAAMARPSTCEEEPLQMKDQSEDAEMEKMSNDEGQDEVKSELPENDVDGSEVEAEEESDDQEVETDDAEEVESEDEDDEKGLRETTPNMEEASVVKYSVKTTPYLQSVRKTIEGEASACRSRQKSSIKDLKFLTPVRRSSRIHRKSSRLPAMLADHDPCVSSLAELVQLDDDANAYIYRRNPALLEDLPQDL